MTRHLSRHLARILTLIFLLAPFTAKAQDWPGKQPIKIIVPFSAGSATDIIARTVFNQVGNQIGQTFVVENRGGAGTTIGSAMVARAEPDGYTLLVNSTSHVVVASTYANLPYSVADDFADISELADIPFVVAASTKYNTLNDLIAAGKKPGSHILYGTAGAGSSGQLFMEHLRLAAGFAATNVPFRGTPEGMNEAHRRPPRRLSGAGPERAAACQSRQDPCARNQRRQAAGADAGRADAGRGGIAKRAVQFLDRRVRTRQDAEADRRSAQPRSRRRAGAQGHRRENPHSSAANLPR